jgi:hypothetical protein
VVDRRFVLAGERLQTGKVVEQAWIVRILLEAALDRSPRALEVARAPRGNRLRDPFPRRDLVGTPRRAADGERSRVRLGRDRTAPGCGIADEDDRSGPRVELLARDGEAGGAAEDDVDLLVMPRGAAELVVLLDQLIARVLGPVGVDAEGGDAQRPAQGLPLQLAEGRQRLDLVETDD